MEDAPAAKRCQVSVANADDVVIVLRTYNAPAPALGDHLFGCVLVAQHYTACVHHHQLVERSHRSCTMRR
jgi:hypothetical protein